MTKQNLYESVVSEVADWMDRMVDEIAPEVMGGKQPPFAVRLSSPEQIYAAYSRMTPQEAWAHWNALPPEDQARLARIMQTGGTQQEVP